MNGKLDKNSLGYLGIDYQYRLVKCFVEDSKFFRELANIIEPAYFTDPLLRLFVDTVCRYYRRESMVPSYDTICIQLKDRATTEIEVAETDALIKKVKFETSLEGMTTVEELATKFFKQQNYAKIAKKIIECVEHGDDDKFDEIQHLWDEASLAGGGEDFGYSVFDEDVENEAFSPTASVPIPTGVSALDAVLNGGLDKGKVGVIIGSSGFGKTTFATAIASYASTYCSELNNNDGFKVLQIYFEDKNRDIARKHYARIATEVAGFDIEAKDLTKTPVDAEEIRKVVDNYPDRERMKRNLRLKSFLTNTKSATDIERFIKRLINKGFKPDLVIIDYFECLLPEKGGYSNDSEWARQAKTMRKLENIATELDCAIWIPTQGNKGSFTSDLVTQDQAGGSIVKIQAAYVILSIARSIEDQEQNKATLAVLKNRSGASGKVWRGIKYNNGTSVISCDDVIEYDNALTWKEDEEKAQEQDRINRIRSIQGECRQSGN